MKKLMFALVALAALTFMVSSCKKDNDNPSPSNGSGAQTKTQILTSQDWKISSMMVGTIDIHAGQKACEKDNFYTFKSNGTYVNDEGATKCIASAPQTEAGTWKFIDNETKIVIDETDTSVIKSLTSASMVAESQFVDDANITRTIVTTFVKK